jgi:hypothetical protein
MRYVVCVSKGVYDVYEGGRRIAAGVSWFVALAIVQRRV